MTTTSPPTSHSPPDSPEDSSASRTTLPSSEAENSKGKATEAKQTPPPASAAESTSDSSDNKKSEPAEEDAQPSTEAATPAVAGAVTAAAGDWQAIYSPAHSAYYFYNTVTQETTWTNPLQQAQPTASTSTSSSPPPEAAVQPSPAVSSIYALQAAAAAQGIDPSLAHLDPSLAGPSTSNPAFQYTAKFNSRTGAFARPDGRDPTHLSEYERAKRMSMAYFDVGQWEEEVEARHEEEEAEGKKRKRPTKKDLVRYLFYKCMRPQISHVLPFHRRDSRSRSG